MHIQPSLQLVILMSYNTLFPYLLSNTINQHVSTYRRIAFTDFESIVNPEIYVYVEKGCNFGIFDGFLNKRQSALLKRGGNGLKEATSIINGQTCALLSHFLTVPDGLRPVYFTFPPRLHLVGRTFHEILKILKESGVDRFENEMVKFETEREAGYVIYKLRVEEKMYLESVFMREDEIMTGLRGIEKKIRVISKLRQDGKLVDMATKMTVELLEGLRIVKGIDFEEFPELIEKLFPFRMLELRFGEGNQFMTIGVDLRSWDDNVKEKYKKGYFITFEI